MIPAVAVKPYSGDYHALPLRNRSQEGVPALIASSEATWGPMTDPVTFEQSCARMVDGNYVAYQRLVLAATFGDMLVVLYGCDEGAYCDLADADAFRASVEEGLVAS